MPANDYSFAQEKYAQLHVDTEAALAKLATVPISMHCWQGDDVGGFEKTGMDLGGGLAVTGNYPGKARTMEELRGDLDRAFSLIPGKHRVNLHACYADLDGKKVERNEYTTAQFQSWIDWSKERGLGLDFNPTFFAHPLAESGLTLTSPDKGVRQYWIEHAIACRKIGADIGRQLGSRLCDERLDSPMARKTSRSTARGPRVTARNRRWTRFSPKRPQGSSTT